MLQSIVIWQSKTAVSHHHSINHWQLSLPLPHKFIIPTQLCLILKVVKALWVLVIWIGMVQTNPNFLYNLKAGTRSCTEPTQRYTEKFRRKSLFLCVLCAFSVTLCVPAIEPVYPATQLYDWYKPPPKTGGLNYLSSRSQFHIPHPSSLILPPKLDQSHSIYPNRKTSYTHLTLCWHVSNTNGWKYVLYRQETATP